VRLEGWPHTHMVRDGAKRRLLTMRIVLLA